jgi:hypothetical protein
VAPRRKRLLVPIHPLQLTKGHSASQQNLRRVGREQSFLFGQWRRSERKKATLVSSQRSTLGAVLDPQKYSVGSAAGSRVGRPYGFRWGQIFRIVRMKLYTIYIRLRTYIHKTVMAIYVVIYISLRVRGRGQIIIHLSWLPLDFHVLEMEI